MRWAYALASSLDSLRLKLAAPQLAETEHALRVSVEHALLDVVRIAQFIPLAQQARIWNAGIIAAKQNFFLQSSSDVADQRRRKILWRITRHFPIDVAFVQGYAVISSTHGQPVCAAMIVRFGKSAANSSTADGCAWRILAPSPGQACSHPGRADIDHHRNLEFIDNFKERIQPRVVDGEMPHDGMEVEPQHSKIADGVFCFTNRGLAFEWIERTHA